MQDVGEPATGQFPAVHELAEPEELFVLLPVVGEPEARVALFADGSYTRWLPATVRKIVGSRPWELGANLFGGVALVGLGGAVVMDVLGL